MKKTLKNNLLYCLILFVLFGVFTFSVKTINVAKVGNKLSLVGFSSLNEVFFKTFPKNDFWFNLSEIFGYLAIVIVATFALYGLYQLIKKRSLKKIDKKLYILAGFYAVVMAAYFLFEVIIINYRPILIDGVLEASYPSSHTILALCIFGSGIIMANKLFYDKILVKSITNIVFTLSMVVTVVSRLMSGVHWFTDILGGVLLSAALLMTFFTVIDYVE